MKDKRVVENRYGDFCKDRNSLELSFSYAYDSEFQKAKQLAFRKAFNFNAHPFHTTYIKRRR